MTFNNRLYEYNYAVACAESEDPIASEWGKYYLSAYPPVDYLGSEYQEEQNKKHSIHKILSILFTIFLMVIGALIFLSMYIKHINMTTEDKFGYILVILFLFVIFYIQSLLF